MVSNSIFCRGLSRLEYNTPRPRVTIHVDGQGPGLNKPYTTLDQIEGTVSIDVNHTTKFHDIDISFEGYSKVSVERTVQVPGQRVAHHTFLRLRQPIEPDAYPKSGFLEPKRSYRFPFIFVIPERLLPQSCDHEQSDVIIRPTHTQLPPTFGSHGPGGSYLNDMAPDTCQISYVIRVRILKESPGDSRPLRPFVDVSRKLRVIPIINRELLRKVNEKGRQHSMRREKPVKCGLIKQNLGQLVVTACPPEPILLDHLGSGTHTTDTAITVHLQFHPKGDEQPPQLKTLQIKLSVLTFHASTPWKSHPLGVDSIDPGEIHQDLAIKEVPLSSYSFASTGWTKQSSSKGPTRSLRLLTKERRLGESLIQGNYYTTSITVPITLPKNIHFVSTFHSCFISRIYNLNLCVSYYMPKKSILKSTLTLKVPITLDVAAPFLWDGSKRNEKLFTPLTLLIP
ncbi:hypothetical protein BDV23DRAFT_195970 [Aspergillus alliaceus]|uniref:Arrestin-like N-terminal domain-containing protein n=1 Tax=Petromyces alliaceus TaxID=209559 RepID=A0A5N7BZC1_PETAA|nr:hypothetical protein BDV23DRAFT_195970 [Aspergillus alliaceus]